MHTATNPPRHIISSGKCLCRFSLHELPIGEYQFERISATDHQFYEITGQRQRIVADAETFVRYFSILSIIIHQ